MRTAVPDDVAAVCGFGETHVVAHYAPLIGEEAAAEQVRTWWEESHIGAAVAAGQVVVAVAVADGEVVGVGQRGRSGEDHVIYKLYVAPDHRGAGLGPRLVDALVAQLPPDVDRVAIEHFAANERAGAFYEREGFRVERVERSPSGDPARDVVWRARAVQRPSGAAGG
ncbi:GNAT family N-acetyltransferase [Auraticoccus sp. F435]|uniref:GNAT family N-acetyltransferase n=1 Tax=Auraticoccus cholistanensis TaxID=2656650 RepID=A0A6A9UTJ2_9ACTN|nr:GNAT family N-acetyltransferase [Auraticoccus cholistanensis]